MKKIIFISLILLFTLNSVIYCQSTTDYTEVSSDLKERFNKDANSFFKLFNKENWMGMTDMMYPKLFTIATKEQMITALAQIGESGMKMTINEVNIYKVSNPIEEEGEVFRKLSYNAKMEIKISGEMLESYSMLEESFKGVFGENNVKYDKEISTFKINSDKALIAIAKKKSSDWKYLEFNESQPAMLQALFPDSVYQSFKSK